MPSRTRVCSVNYDQSSIDNSTICPKSDLLRVTKVALFVKAIAAILRSIFPRRGYLSKIYMMLYSADLRHS